MMMKRLYFWIVILVIASGFTKDTYVSTQKFILPKGVSAQDFLSNTLIIKFKKSSNISRIQSNIKSQLQQNGLTLQSIESIFPEAQNNSAQQYQTLKNTNQFQNYYRIKYNGTRSIEKVINDLQKNSEIEYAEPSYIYTVEYTPNDPSFNNQFYLSQIKMPQAWDINRSSSNVIIGIVDTGSEITHEDLAANIYLNTADPINGIDDDGDGYVDNYYGWDLCGATAAAMLPDNDPNVKSKAADHGVHVSGIASAVTNNGLGVASAAINAKLLIAKAGTDDKATSIYRGYEGVKYCADKGAQIINCSWGGPGGGQFGKEMIDYAISKGCLVIAAAGNSANDTPFYPAAFEGVLAVANLKYDDVKGQYSNFGTYVDISAPGEGILNTTYNNTYSYYSGTSMAAPLVASAAALVKSYFPNLSGLQIAELLRATADNIDAQNPNYIGRLGSGRLNVFRALTEAAYAVRYQNLKIIDMNLGNRAPGTTIDFQFDIKNFINPVTGLSVDIQSNSSNIQILNPHIEIGNMATLQVKSSVVLKVKILESAISNEEVMFTLKYSGNDGNYQSTEYFKEIVALDYLNVTYNKISTTFTSNGRVGYSRANAEAGLGFMYKDENMLYEASLMIAKSDVQVSNNARYDSNNSNDFKPLQTAAQNTSKTNLFEGYSTFNDSNSAFPIGIEVKSEIFAFNNADDDKYVIVEYEIKNTNNTEIDGIYPGLFTDWDLDESEYNATEYNDELKLAYAYAKKNSSFPYAGVKILGTTSNPAYYPLSYQVPNNFLSDNLYTISEKYKSLSSGVYSHGLGYDSPNGYDIMFAIGSGPYNIPSQKTIKVAFAFVAGDDLDDLKIQANKAQLKYEAMKVETLVPSDYFLAQNYPNGAKQYTKIQLGIPVKSHLQLTLYDINGKKVKEITNEEYQEGTYVFDVKLEGLPRGVYFYEMKTDRFSQRKKMLVLN